MGQQNRMANYSTGTPATQQGSGNVASLQKYVDANQGAGLNQANRLSDATNKDIKAFNDDNKAKTAAINEGADAARTLFEQNGTQYQNNLNQWQQGINSFNTLTDRGQYDPTAQQINAFTQGQDYNIFNNLRTGAGYDQQKYLDMLSAGMNYGATTQQAIQQKANDIQTEEGRYRLLQQASSPYGNRASIGGNRLNQLLFQANPNAVKTLQTQFQGQAGDVANQMSAFNQLGFNTVNPLIEQEAALANNLQTGATNLQNTFENKMATQANYDIVNDARKALYDQYVNQFNGGQISSDLANQLGISNMGGFGYSAGNFGPDANQFTAYNTGRPQTDYFTQSLAKADNLQSVLGTQDFGTYQNLGKLSGDALEVSGPSNLGSVLALGGSNYRDDLLAADAAFRNNYGGKTFTAMGVGYGNTQPVGSSGAINNYAGLHEGSTFQPFVNQYQSDTRAAADAGAVDLAPTVRNAYYTTSVDDLLNGANPTLNDQYVQGGWYPNTSPVYNQNYGTNAVTQANSALDQLKNQLSNTGVQDINTLTGQETTGDATYTLLKSLGLI